MSVAGGNDDSGGVGDSSSCRLGNWLKALKALAMVVGADVESLVGAGVVPSDKDSGFVKSSEASFGMAAEDFAECPAS